MLLMTVIELQRTLFTRIRLTSPRSLNKHRNFTSRSLKFWHYPSFFFSHSHQVALVELKFNSVKCIYV